MFYSSRHAVFLECFPLQALTRDVKPRMLALPVGTRTGATPMEKKNVIRPRKSKNQAAVDPAVLLTVMYPEESKTGPLRDLCTPTFAAVLLAITQRCGPCGCPRWTSGSVRCACGGATAALQRKRLCHVLAWAGPWGHWTHNEPSTRAPIPRVILLREVPRAVKSVKTDLVVEGPG